MTTPQAAVAASPQRNDDRLPWRHLLDVFLPFALGYFISYLFRVINALISNDISRDLGLSPGQLGLLTSVYFLAFGLFQLPLGLLLDRFGPRRVNAALLSLAAVGALLFALAQDVTSLLLARALIGIGVSSCLMGAIKAFVYWFPMSRLASLNGWLIAMGGVGALTASMPVELALRVTDWRGVFMGLSLATLLVAAVVLWKVPERFESRRETWPELFDGLRRVFATPVFWLVSLPFGLAFGVFQAVQGLWIAPWLSDVAGLSRADIGQALLVSALGMISGLILFGSLSDRLTRQGRSGMRLFCLGTCLALLPLGAIALGVVSLAGLDIAWALFPLATFFLMAASLGYAIVSSHFPRQMAGRVNTSINLLVMGFSFLFQWGIGAVIALWPPLQGRYPLEAYQTAFGLCVASIAIAMLPLLFSRHLRHSALPGQPVA
jgi:MFS family permease